MSDDEYNYAKDSRIPCKYGTKCYQKNPVHHQNYKHPSNFKIKHNAAHVNKKMKTENVNKESKEIVTCNDVSDSDDYNIEDYSDTSSNKNCKVSNQVSDSESDDEKYGAIKKGEESTKVASEDLEVHVINNISTSVRPENNEKNNDITEKTDNLEDKNQATKDDEKDTIIDYRHFIKDKFLVDMPEDFYQFWEYCKKKKSSNTLEALKEIGLKLVGPFDALAGKFNNINKRDEEYLLHWRYYHDPPEFQTVLKGDDKTGYHIGYFRDLPDEPPVFLVSNSAKKDGILHQMGANIFSAVNMYLDDLKKSGDPFKKMHVGRIQTSLKKEAENLKLDLCHRPDSIISREKKIVTRTFNKIGLVVPYNRKTQLGYRELALNNKDLASLFTKLQNALPEQKSKYLSELQPVFTFASIATDECDFGTGIELGWNIISHGVDTLNSTALRFLTINYRLLNREAFAKIAETHMNNRKKGCDLSII